MNSSIRDSYLETQVTTATPQRLRLMLIEAALRRLKSAQAAWQDGQTEVGVADVRHCREMMTELIGGIQPDGPPLVKNVLGIYLFMFSTLVEAEVSRDAQRLADVIRVLDEERLTWQAVCEQLPERPAPNTIAAPAEEIAPQRVPQAWHAGYSQAVPAKRASAAACEFSIEA